MKRGMIALVALCTLPAQATSVDSPTPYPVSRVWVYEPVSNHTDTTMGEMRLSERSLSFSLLKGQMNIKYVGRAADPEGLGSSAALIYRVENAEHFFELNKDANGFCNKPVAWFGIVAVNDPLHQPWVRVFFIRLPIIASTGPISVASARPIRLCRRTRAN